MLRLAEPGAVLADRGFTVTPDGRHAVAGVGREFMTWDLTSNRSDAPRGPVDGDVLAVTAHAGGEPIAAAGMDGVARVWSMTGVAPLALLRHPAPVRAVAFAPDGRRLATGCDDHVVRIWEPVDD